MLLGLNYPEHVILWLLKIRNYEVIDLNYY